MHSQRADEATILAMLERLSALVFARDAAVVDELWSDSGFRLIGSEDGEDAATRDELVALFGALFAKPFRVSWTWQDLTLVRHDDMAWACARAQLEIAYPERVERKPYRLVGIFQCVHGTFRWRLFSGSEPAG